MKNYYLAYPPEVQASLDDRLLKIKNDLRDVTMVMHKDIQIAMQRRLAFQQNTEEDEDELMKSASGTESPPSSPARPPPTSPAVSPLRDQLNTPVRIEGQEEEEEEQMIVEEETPVNRTQEDS